MCLKNEDNKRLVVINFNYFFGLNNTYESYLTFKLHIYFWSCDGDSYTHAYNLMLFTGDILFHILISLQQFFFHHKTQ